jgi:hypothetical protein
MGVSQPAVKSADIKIYDQAVAEVILMMDDVGVKAQKPHKKVARVAQDAKRLDTTVVIVQDMKQKYHYATTGIDKSGKVIYDIETAITDKVCQLHDVQKPIPLVAITDGAKSIRLILYAIFGSHICIILDWYHLQLKLKNLMSMIAHSKEDKELYINDLKALLWAGKTTTAIEYIDKMQHIRNEEKRQELRTYLEKHTLEIIDYGLRQMKIKGNQKNLFKAVQEMAESAVPLDSHRSVEKNKGRTEVRALEVYPFPEHLQKDWKNACVCIKLIRSGIREGKSYSNDNYYMSSLCEEVKAFQEYIRAYWGVENDLHGTLGWIKCLIISTKPSLLDGYGVDAYSSWYCELKLKFCFSIFSYFSIQR